LKKFQLEFQLEFLLEFLLEFCLVAFEEIPAGIPALLLLATVGPWQVSSSHASCRYVLILD
jgi:hypothetical protein